MGIWTGHHVRTRASTGAVSPESPPDERGPWGRPAVQGQVGARVWDHTAKPEKKQAGGLSRARAQTQRRPPALAQLSGLETAASPPGPAWLCPCGGEGDPTDTKSPDPEVSTAPLRQRCRGPETPDPPFHRAAKKSENKRLKKSLDPRGIFWVMNMISHLIRIC